MLNIASQIFLLVMSYRIFKLWAEETVKSFMAPTDVGFQMITIGGNGIIFIETGQLRMDIGMKAIFIRLEKTCHLHPRCNGITFYRAIQQLPVFVLGSEEPVFATVLNIEILRQNILIAVFKTATKVLIIAIITDLACINASCPVVTKITQMLNIILPAFVT